MTLAYEDVTVANRFQRTADATIPASTLPEGYPFKTVDPTLVGQQSVPKSTLCNSDYKNINALGGGDPLEKLAALVESLAAPDGVCVVGPDETVACPGGYCVPYLTSQGSVHHTSCVTEAEMFPPIADTAVQVRRANVAINPSAAFGRPLYFGPVAGSSPPSCVRVTVGGQGFVMSDVVVDQTGCEKLDSSYRIAVAYGGNSAAGSTISGLSVFGAPAPAVAYLGNAADGDAPYLLVSDPGLADAVLRDVSFVFETEDLSSEPVGLVAAMARTVGTQLISQCSRSDCTDARVRTFDDRCAEPAICSQRGCPWDLAGPGCTSDPDAPCADFCAPVVLGKGFGCTRGLANASTEYVIAREIEVGLTPPQDAAISGYSTLKSARADETGSFCIPSRWPLGQPECDPSDQAQQWFVEDFRAQDPDGEPVGPFRVHPVHRPFTCLLLATGSDGNTTAGFFPCPPCMVGSEETVDVCDGTAPTFDDIVVDATVETVPEDALLIPVSYSNPELGVVAYPNGSCLLRSPTRLWADCRTECIRDVPEAACNGTGIVLAGGLLQACAHRGAVAAILKQTCTSGGPIVQDPSGSGGAVDCFHGYYRISAHGRGYVSGPATVNGGPVTIYTSQAVVQPYDEQTAVTGIGVDVFNVSAATALFGRAFERNLFPSNKSTALYLVLAVVAFAVGIIALVVAMVKVAKRKQD